MNKDNYTVIAYPQKPIIAETTVTNTTTPINMAEVEQLRKENKRLQEKVEEYMLKECMSRVESLTYSTSKKTLRHYLDDHNPIMVFVECFKYSSSHSDKIKELYDAYGFDTIIKAIRSLFAEDDKEEEDE